MCKMVPSCIIAFDVVLTFEMQLKVQSPGEMFPGPLCKISVPHRNTFYLSSLV